MRKLIYYVAITIDGFIAHEDGSWDGFSMEGEHVEDFFKSYDWFDTVLMGRNTYEAGVKQGVTNPYPSMRQYVFSQTMAASPDDNVELVSDGAIDVVKQLKDTAGKPIWLCGGSNLATQFMAARLIDEVILKLSPVVFGAGIPLFSKPMTPAALELTQTKRYDSGVTRLHYRVASQRSA